MATQISVTAAQALAYRSALGVDLLVEDLGNRYRLYVPYSQAIALVANINKDGGPEQLAFEANEYQFANVPINHREIRFVVHDLASKDTWSGKTNGDPVIHLAGGVAFIEEVGLWFTAQGQPALYDYDDVNYKLYTASLDGQGNKVRGTLLAYLDQSAMDNRGAGSVWRYPDDSVACSYDAQADEWKDDQGTVRTSSRFSVVPYPNHKVKIVRANLATRMSASIASDGAVHYRAYSYVDDPALLGNNPPGVYRVVDWEYPDLKRFFDGCTDYWVENPLAADSPVRILFDYAATATQDLDAIKQQRLDIITKNHRKVTDTDLALATFLAVETTSF